MTEDRITRWKDRKEAEAKRQKTGVVEERLIYYADFYDLRTILKKHWDGEFKAAFEDWKVLEVWLDELEKLRDPDAHRRELLPHQKHLILGISGDIRIRIVKYRSKRETSEDYYPRIESLRDNLGNIFTYGDISEVSSRMKLRVGDSIEFVITAIDPMGESLQYGIFDGVNLKWQESNVITIKLTEKHVGKRFAPILAIKSNRKYHASEEYDHAIVFNYEVLPPI